MDSITEIKPSVKQHGAETGLAAVDAVMRDGLGRVFPAAVLHIRRAGSQVTIARAESEIDLLFNHIVDAVYLPGAVGQLTARFQNLNSQVVLFVNHRREEFTLGDHYSPGTFAEGMVPADKMPFNEKMFIKSRGFIYADIEDFIAKIERHHNVSELIEYFRFFCIRAAAQEFVAGQIPGKSDPRGYYDIGQRPGTVKPLVYIIAYVGQFHVRIAYRL